MSNRRRGRVDENTDAATCVFALAIVLFSACAACAARAPNPINPTTDAGTDPNALVFRRETLPVRSSTRPPNLFGVWGSSTSDVFVVGDRASIFHYDGETWTRETSTATEDLYSVWGTSADQVFACGAGGTVLHRTDTGWVKEAVPVKAVLHAIRGAANGSAVYAVGVDATVLRRNTRGVWSAMPADTLESLSGLWVSDAGDQGVAVGNLGTVIRLAGNRWNRQRIAGLVTALHGVWGPAQNDLFIVGLDGTVLHSRGGPFSAVGGPSCCTNADCAPGITCMRDPHSDCMLGQGSCTTPQVYLRDIFGTSSGDAYIVGWGGTIAHTDGTIVEPYPNLAGGYRLESVWAAPLDPPTAPGPDGGVVLRTRVYAVGVSGTVLVGPKLDALPPMTRR